MRLGQEIRVPIEPQGTCLKHDRLQVNVGGIRPLLGLNVPDILRGQVKPAQMQGLERASVDICHVTVTNPESVDLEVQGDGLEGLLPTPILQRNVALNLGTKVFYVDVQRRLVEHDVRDHSAMEQR